MRILFDQGTPVPLRRALPSGSVSTVYEQGWATLQNGQLLAVAEQAGFDVFITTDQNLNSDAIRMAVEQLTPGAYIEFPIR